MRTMNEQLTEEVYTLLREVQEEQDRQKALRLLEEGLERYPSNIYVMVRLAAHYRLLGKSALALELLQQAKEIAPTNYYVLYEYGRTARREAYIWHALEALSYLVVHHPDDPDPRFQHALSWALVGSIESTQVFPTVEELITQYPERIRYRIGYAELLFRAGRYREALQKIDEIIPQHPTFTDCWQIVANASYELGQRDRWEEAALKLHEIAPNLAPTHFWMGRYHLTKDFVKASDHLRKAIQIHPRFYKAYIELGYWYWQANLLDDAHICLKKAVQIACWSGQAQGVLAWFQVKTGLGEPYLEGLKNLAHDHPYNGLDFYLARIYTLMERHDDAKPFWQMAVSHAPDNPTKRWLFGAVNITWEEYKAAIDELKEAVNLLPDFAKAWKSLGYAFLKDEQFSNAVEAYETYLNHVTHDIEIYHELGVAYLYADQGEKAVEYLQKAHHLAPQNGHILLALVEAFLMKPDLEKAKALGLKAQKLLPEDEELAQLIASLEKRTRVTQVKTPKMTNDVGEHYNGKDF